MRSGGLMTYRPASICNARRPLSSRAWRQTLPYGPPGRTPPDRFHPLDHAYAARAPAGVEITIRVHLDLWYPGPPTKGGPRHGNVTVRRSPDPLDRGARFDESHAR